MFIAVQVLLFRLKVLRTPACICNQMLMTHFFLYIRKVWVTVACSHAAMPPLCPMQLDWMVKTILGLWWHTGRVKHSRNRISRRVAAFPCDWVALGAFGYVGPLSTVKEGTTSQDTAGRFMESVSLLSAFKASSYGCGEPGAPFQQGGKDQGKGQSMRHNDLILSHAVMRYCSLTCWEEDKECHTHLWEASIWTIKLEHSNASSLGLVVMLVVPKWTLFFLLPHYQEIPKHEMRAYFSQSYVCVCYL